MTITNGVKNKTLMPGVTPIADVVDAPTIGTATAGFESATVAYTAATTGGAATSFTAISTPESITGSSATSPITVSGLTGGTAYTFKVYGTNASGTWSAVQSAASNSVTPTTTAFDSISTSTLTSGTTASFTSIPSTYQHLQIRIHAKTAVDGADIILKLNNDSAANYTQHYFLSNGSSSLASGSTGEEYIYVSPTTSSYPLLAIIEIHDYASTSKFKTVFITNGSERGASGQVAQRSGLWRSTSAVNRLDFSIGGTTFTNATFALYGISGS